MGRLPTLGMLLALVGCGGMNLPSLPSLPGLPGSAGSGIRQPALDVLSLDFERTEFGPTTRVAGRVAAAERDLRLSIPTSGRLRRAGKGPIPTEVRVEMTRLVTGPRGVQAEGRVVLRDLGFGKTIATLDGFRGTGPMPAAGAGASTRGFVFRGIEDEIIAWLGTLSCDTALRICSDAPPTSTGSVGVAAIEAPVPDGADLNLEELVSEDRPRSLRRINTGGIDPEKVVAAAIPVTPDASAGAGGTRLGETVAALGPLARSGFWLQTPLVAAETTGEIRVRGTDKSLAVTLIPKDGPRSGGSQISLAALSELGLPVTALVTLDVFR